MERILCVLAVHFNNTTEVRRYVDHVLGLPVPAGWSVVVSVADNSRSWQEGSSTDPRFLMSAPEENLGYLNGCAFALDHWRATSGRQPDWVAVTNTDLQFDPAALIEMLGNDWPSGTGAVAPQIRTATHYDQNPFMRARPSRVRLRCLQTVFGHRLFRTPLVHLLRSPLYAAWSRHKSRQGRVMTGPSLERNGSPRILAEIYAPHGCAVFLPRAFFEAGCTLTMPWKMFGEEVFLAEQIRRVGLDVWWAPGIRVYHEMASTTRGASSTQLMNWKAEALGRLIDLYFSDTVRRGPGSRPR